jgi:hypothetical protein
MDAEGANDVVAADVIDDVPAIDADGTKDMVAAATCYGTELRD